MSRCSCFFTAAAVVSQSRVGFHAAPVAAGKSFHTVSREYISEHFRFSKKGILVFDAIPSPPARTGTLHPRIPWRPMISKLMEIKCDRMEISRYSFLDANSILQAHRTEYSKQKRHPISGKKIARRTLHLRLDAGCFNVPFDGLSRLKYRE